MDELVEALDDGKVLFGVVKTGLGKATSAFERLAVLYFVYKGPNLGVVKSAKFMARKLQVQAFAGACTKIVASARSDCCEDVKGDIMAALSKVDKRDKPLASTHQSTATDHHPLSMIF